MKRKLFYHLLIILIFSGTRLFAQSNNDPPTFSMTAEYTKLIPNSPETSALGKYGIIPVSLYDGIPNISIPIYEIHWGSLTLPISFSYYNNGLKPSEDASKVGLGWCLNAGGAITRVVRGLVDESPNSTRFDTFPNLGDFANDQDILDSIANGRIDGEPDLYIFNFNGHSGKFIYLNGRAYFTSQEDLKISKNGEDFQIVTEDGTLYDFQAKDVTSWHHIFASELSVPQHYSAWFLTKITSKDKKDVITFDYNTSPYQHGGITIDSYVESYQNGTRTSGSDGSNTIYPTVTNTQELSSINFGSYSVKFIPDSETRLDIPLSNRHALKSIEVKASTTKKFNFVYGYFGGNSKLKLSEIQYVDSNNGSLLNKYIFNYYNETAAFPDQNTRGVDGWGYYNGKYNQSLISGDRNPDFFAAETGVLNWITYPTGGKTYFEYEPNRYGGSLEYVYVPKSAFCATVYTNNNNGDPETTSKNFTIKENQVVNIHYGRDSPDLRDYGIAVSPYPILKIMKGSKVYYRRSINYRADSGSDILTLDAGTYTMIVGCDENETQTWATIDYKELTQQVSRGTLGPGIRIKSITSYDLISNKNIIKNYSYNNDDGISSGNLLFYPRCNFETVEWQKEENCLIIDGIDLRYNSDIRSGIGAMLDYDFYYSKVTETIADGITTGKTVTDFSRMDNGMQTVVNVAPIKEVQWKSIGSGSFKKAKETHFNYYIYSFPPAFGSKSVLAKTTYLHYNNLCPLMSPLPYGSTNCLDTLVRYNIYAPVAANTAFGYYRLSSEENILYSDNPNDSVISKKDYYYDSTRFSMPTKIIEINSKGEKLMTKNKYPYNYFTSPSVLTPDQAEDVYWNSIKTLRENFTSERYNAEINCLPVPQSYFTDTRFKALVKANSAYKSNYFNAYRQAITTRDNNLATYNSSLANAISLSAAATQKAILIMQRDHIMRSPIEQQIYKTINNANFVTAASKSTYSVTSGDIPVAEGIWDTEFTIPVDSAVFNANSDTYFKKKIEFTYDDNCNLVQQKKIDNVPHAYVWDYFNKYIIAEAINANYNDIAYTSFEADGTGNWEIPSTSLDTSTSITGNYSNQIDINSEGSISKRDLNSSKIYTVSYWSNSGSYDVTGSVNVLTGRTVSINGTNWTYYEHTVSNTTAVSITGNGKIDELRLYPKTAQMTTYTYEPFVGITSQTDPKGMTTYYEYDTFQRLKYIKDQNGNIIKSYDYNYNQ